VQQATQAEPATIAEFRCGTSYAHTTAHECSHEKDFHSQHLPGQPRDLTLFPCDVLDDSLQLAYSTGEKRVQGDYLA
jgi:hypothetical protein